MIVIDLNGEIGWEIRPSDVADKLAQTKGENIVVRLSTIGGDVFDGADIVNLFIDHRRDNPGIKMNLEIKAIAASYGSALASCGVWDSIGVSRVSAFMMHKASTFAYLNSDDLEELKKFLIGLDNVYSELYASQSKKTVAQSLQLMKDETWYFGQQIIDEGFADKIITMEDEGGQPLLLEPENIDPTIILFDMKKKRDALMKKQKLKAKDERFDIKRAAACLRLPEENTTMEIPGEIPVINKPEESGKSKQEVPKVKDKAELKKELPGLHDEVFNDGVMAEREKEKVRLTALASLKTQDDYKDIPEVTAVIDKAIVEGNTVEETNTMMTAAMVKLLKKPGKIDEIESPGEITGGDPVTPAMKTEKQREV